MPGFWSKFKAVAQPAAQVAQVVAPAPVGKIAQLVERAIADPDDPQNLKALRILGTRIETLEARIAHLEQVVTFRR